MKFKNIVCLLLIAFFIALSGCSPSAEEMADVPTIELKSNAFDHGKEIPAKYTCEGEDISPDLTWGKPPEGTVELALICDDPDAPVVAWTHWVVYGIPADTGGFGEAFPDVEQTETGILQGQNNWRKIGYGGPCPPRGKPHRYFFKLYALDKELGLKSGADKESLEKAMKGHIIGYGELMGTYAR